MSESLIVMILLTFLVIVAFSIIILNDLLTAIILLGVYSLTAAATFMVMDAVDVAFTEAAVGAGISTIILLGTLTLTRREQKVQKHNNYFALFVVTITGGLLIYGTLDMPSYGDGNAIVNQHPQLAQHYIQKSEKETGIPNIVTSVLASYRGYDTLGETAVVFTAAIAVLSLLGLRRRRRDDEPEWNKELQRRQQNEDVS